MRLPRMGLICPVTSGNGGGAYQVYRGQSCGHTSGSERPHSVDTRPNYGLLEQMWDGYSNDHMGPYSFTYIRGIIRARELKPTLLVFHPFGQTNVQA